MDEASATDLVRQMVKRIYELALSKLAKRDGGALCPRCVIDPFGCLKLRLGYRASFDPDCS